MVLPELALHLVVERVLYHLAKMATLLQPNNFRRDNQSSMKVALNQPKVSVVIDHEGAILEFIWFLIVVIRV